MEQKPMKMDKVNMLLATNHALRRVVHIIELAKAMQTDADREKRMERHECLACFHGGKIGGAMMTERPCGLCGTLQMYGSTCTDALCLRCAQEHRLCKHCGGDIDMRANRRKWPEAYAKETKP